MIIKVKRKIALILALLSFMQFCTTYAEDYFEGMENVMDSIYKYDLGEFVDSNETDEVKGEYERDINIVCSLGIMSLKDSGSFEGTASLGNSDFYDAISALQSKDYTIESDNILDGNITYRKALTAILSILGYDGEQVMYDSEEEWITVCSSELKLTKNLSVNLDKFIQRQEFARLLVNSFDVDIAKPTIYTSNNLLYTSQKGVNILMENLDIYKIKGCINAVPGINIYSGEAPDFGVIEIDRVRVNVGKCSYAYDMVGTSVTAYKKIDDNTGEQVLLYCEEDSKNPSVYFGLDEISDYSSSYIYYEKNGTEKKLKISSLKYIIYNGEAKNDISILDNIKDLEGSISVCDSTGTGYDVIIIKTYASYLVDSVDLYENRIRLAYGAKFDGKSYIEIKDNEDFILNVDGVYTTDLSVIKPKMVVSVLQNNSASCTEIRVSSKNIYGEVKSYNSEGNSVLIDEEEIKIDSGYIELYETSQGRVSKITSGTIGTFYISSLGYIAGFKDNNAKLHGYIKRAYLSDDGETVQIKLFSEEGKWENLGLKESLKVDGKKITAAEFLSYFQSHEIQNTIIEYGINEKNEVKEIDTIILGENEQKKSSMRIDYTFSGINKYWTGLWSVTIDAKCRADENTVVFCIPLNGDERRYEIASYDSGSVTNQQGKFEFYNSDEFLLAKYVVLSKSATGGIGSVEIGDNVIMFTEINPILDEDDNVIWKIDGIEFIGTKKATGNCKTKELYVEDDVLESFNLTENAVYTVNYDSDGYVHGVVKLMDCSDKKDFKVSTSNKNQVIYQCGTVKAVDPTTKMLLLSNAGEETSWCMRAIAVYDSATGKTRMADASDIYVGDRIFVCGNLGHLKASLVIR